MKKRFVGWFGILLLCCAWQAWGQRDCAAGFDDIKAVQIPNDLNYWKNASFGAMIGPLRLPSDREHLESIRVWLKVPTGEKIGAAWLASQSRYTLIYPPGTVADRVDSAKPDVNSPEKIDDVRGARIDAQSNTIFHDYETVPGQSQDWLRGYEWKRNGAAVDKKAADALVKLFFPAGYNWDPSVIKQFRDLNRCAACHLPNAPSPLTTAPPFRFESDSRGYFQPITVLQNSETVRDHRNWDLNAGDPFITVWCGSHKTHAVVFGDVRKYFCPHQVAPVGKLDLRAALLHHDPHAERVCESRRYLYEHMDAQAKAAFSSSFSDCGIGQEAHSGRATMVTGPVGP